jgi:hypothetical protein
MALNDQTLWLKFLGAIANKVAGGSNTLGVQTLYPFALWDWGGTEYPLDSIPYAQQIFLDRVPLAPVGNYLNPPASFSQNYLQFLSQLNLQAGNDPELERLYKAYDDAVRSLDKAQKDADLAYRNDKSRPEDEPYERWLANSSVWKSKIRFAEDAVEAAGTNYNNYRAQKFTDIKRAISRYDDNLLYIKNQAGQPVEVAPWFTSQTPYDFVNTITGGNFGGNATKGQAFAFTMNEETSTYDYERIWGKAAGLFTNGFIGVYAGGKFEQVDIRDFASGWSISFTFQSFDPILVGNPDWYDSGVTQGRRNGPYRTGFSGYKDPSTPKDVWFFGDGGLLSRMTTEMWVAYRPTVMINAGEELHTFFKRKIEAGGGLQIGPFRFGGSGGSETISKFSFSSGYQVIAEAEADWPYIVANAALPTVPPESVSRSALATTVRAQFSKAKSDLAVIPLTGAFINDNVPPHDWIVRNATGLYNDRFHAVEITPGNVRGVPIQGQRYFVGSNERSFYNAVCADVVGPAGPFYFTV